MFKLLNKFKQCQARFRKLQYDLPMTASLIAKVERSLSLKMLISIMASMLKYGQQKHDVCAYSISSV